MTDRSAKYKYFLKNKALCNARTRRYKSLRKEYIQDLRQQPCFDCGLEFPWPCMEFDHRPEHHKVGTVPSLIGGSWKALLAEVGKCDIVCANCHRLRTFVRYGK